MLIPCLECLISSPITPRLMSKVLESGSEDLDDLSRGAISDLICHVSLRLWKNWEALGHINLGMLTFYSVKSVKLLQFYKHCSFCSELFSVVSSPARKIHQYN